MIAISCTTALLVPIAGALLGLGLGVYGWVIARRALREAEAAAARAARWRNGGRL